MVDIETLNKLCKLVRYNILTSTTAAGSGHPTSSLSAVELLATLFFSGFFKSDDKFILSKGHAAPLLYSIYQAASLITREELLTLRKFDSRLEGHPTPRLPFIEAATGSLGQGLSIGLGMALGLKKSRVFVLLGDSEMAEGQIWEAMGVASHYKLGNLIAILDVNRLGQRGETMLGWDLEKYAARAQAFGWNVITVDDGHNLEKISKAYNGIGGAASIDKRPTNYDTGGENVNNRPTIIIAKTIKGRGVSLIEDQDNWHGKALGEEELKKALQELGPVDTNLTVKVEVGAARIDKRQTSDDTSGANPNYALGQSVATREAYGDALVALGKADPTIVVLDAEVSNSTFSNKFAEKFPDRFFEMFIAEQNMVGAALGLSKTGFIPFVSTFSAFFTRTLDQIRMIELSEGNVKFCGSHSGVFIGADGPSQMGLIDMAMFRSILKSVVLYPADATAAFKLTQEMSQTDGIVYLRTNREKTPVIYGPDEEFKIGGSKVHQLKVKSEEFKVAIIAAGITLHEALKAQETLAKEDIQAVVIDCYSIKPLDQQTIQKYDHLPIVVVEDHYPAGGLGEAVLNIVPKITHLCVKKIPKSGTPAELLAYEEINADSIVKAYRLLP